MQQMPIKDNKSSASNLITYGQFYMNTIVNKSFNQCSSMGIFGTNCYFGHTLGKNCNQFYSEKHSNINRMIAIFEKQTQAIKPSRTIANFTLVANKKGTV